MKLAITILWILVAVHILATWFLQIRRGLKARARQSHEPTPAALEQPPVSILVPAWNESQRIEKCIRALQQVDYPCFEALILAGGTDGTFEIANQAIAGDRRFRLLERGPEPKNAALSEGVQAAKHEVLVLLDADNLVEPGWLAALVAPLARGAAASVGDSLPNLWTWVTYERQMWHILTYEILKLPLIQGDRSVAVRREDLERAGGLPTHTYAREDWDLGVRLEKIGGKIAFAKGARLVTDWPSTLRELWTLQVRWRRTHLTGLWEQRDFFFRNLASGFSQLYFYLLSIFIVLALAAGILIAVLQPGTRAIIFQLFFIFFTWLALRRVALAGEIAAFTGDLFWLRKAWTTIAVMLVEIPASIMALLTVQKLNPFYKGARHLAK
jgi:cellulose synthase/poly-beta-1,6-N-acetylglucosamine synthase-like glycosyltransferase